MENTQLARGFAGDPAAALTVVDSAGCGGGQPKPATTESPDAVGNARHYRINQACVSCFPSAADVIMGRPLQSLKP
jgi:hypothetical protein